MLAKMTSKNQITIPKKVLENAGLINGKDELKYFDVEAGKNSVITLKPVDLIIEEKIPEKQWQKFESWATRIEKGDKIFKSPDRAIEYLKRRIKKK